MILTLSILLGIAAALAVVGWREARQANVALTAARLECMADLRVKRAEYDEALERERDSYSTALRVAREGHQAELVRVTALYDRLVQTQATATQDAIRLATTGLAQPQPVEIAEREVDAHTRLSRAVSEQAIEHGIAVLRDGYRALGLQYSDDELREEATLLLSVGTMPSYPPEPQQAGAPEAARA